MSRPGFWEGWVGGGINPKFWPRTRMMAWESFWIALNVLNYYFFFTILTMFKSDLNKVALCAKCISRLMSHPIIIKARCKINLKLNFEKIYFRIRIIAIVPSNVRPSPTRHKQNKLWFNSHTLDALDSYFWWLLSHRSSLPECLVDFGFLAFQTSLNAQNHCS